MGAEDPTMDEKDGVLPLWVHRKVQKADIEQLFTHLCSHVHICDFAYECVNASELVFM